MGKMKKASWKDLAWKFAAVIAVLALIFGAAASARPASAISVPGVLTGYAEEGKSVYLVKQWYYEANVKESVDLHLSGQYEAYLDAELPSFETEKDITSGGVTYHFTNGQYTLNTRNGKYRYSYSVTADVTVSASDVCNGMSYVKKLDFPDNILPGAAQKGAITISASEPDAETYWCGVDEDLPIDGRYFGVKNYPFKAEDPLIDEIFLFKVWKNGLTPETVRIEILQNGKHFGWITMSADTGEFLKVSDLKAWVAEYAPEQQEGLDAFVAKFSLADDDMLEAFVVSDLPQYADPENQTGEYVYTFREAADSGYESAAGEMTIRYVDSIGQEQSARICVISNLSKKTPKPDAPDEDTPKSETKTTKSVTKKTRAPKTGDAEDALVWTIVLGASAACAAAALERKRRA